MFDVKIAIYYQNKNLVTVKTDEMIANRFKLTNPKDLYQIRNQN